eukprot:403334753
MIQSNNGSANKARVSKFKNNLHKHRRSPDQPKQNISNNQTISKSPPRLLKQVSSQDNLRKQSNLTRKKSRDSSNDESNQYFLFKAQPKKAQDKNFVQNYESSRTSIGPKLMNKLQNNKMPSPPHINSNQQFRIQASSTQLQLNNLNLNSLVKSGVKTANVRHFQSLSPKNYFLQTQNINGVKQVKYPHPRKNVTKSKAISPNTSHINNGSSSFNSSNVSPQVQLNRQKKVEIKNNQTSTKLMKNEKLNSFNDFSLDNQPLKVQLYPSEQSQGIGEQTTENMSMSFAQDDFDEMSKVHQIYASNVQRQHIQSVVVGQHHKDQPKNISQDNSLSLEEEGKIQSNGQMISQKSQKSSMQINNSSQVKKKSDYGQNKFGNSSSKQKQSNSNVVDFSQRLRSGSQFIQTQNLRINKVTNQNQSNNSSNQKPKEQKSD